MALLNAVAERREAKRLAEHIVAKSKTPGELDDDRGFKDFIEFRFKSQLRTHSSRAPLYNTLAVGLSLGAIAAGVASTAIAADTSSSPGPGSALFWLGLVVALVTGVTQLSKPGARSRSRYDARNKLRDEGWKFVNGVGAYAEPGDPKAHFVAEVQRIQAEFEQANPAEADPNQHG